MAHQPRRAAPGRGRFRAWLDRRRTPLQIAGQQLACLGLPLFTYWALDQAGLDITSAAYLGVVAALVFTAAAIWVECLAAYRPQRPPDTLEDRIRARARSSRRTCPTRRTHRRDRRGVPAQDYNQLQVILAYEHSRGMPVEDELRAIARRDPRFVPLRVDVERLQGPERQRALARVTGEFVAVSTPTTIRLPARSSGPGAGCPTGRTSCRGTAWSETAKTAPSRSSSRPNSRRSSRRHLGVRECTASGFRGLERLLANLGAEADEAASVHAHGGHRLLDARHRRGGRIVSDPGLVSTESHLTDGARSGASACAGRRGGRRCRCAISGRACATARPERPSAIGTRLPARLARGVPVDLASDPSRSSGTGSYEDHRRSRGSYRCSWRRPCSRSAPASRRPGRPGVSRLPTCAHTVAGSSSTASFRSSSIRSSKTSWR